MKILISFHGQVNGLVNGQVWFFSTGIGNQNGIQGLKLLYWFLGLFKEKVDRPSEVSPDRESGWFFNGIGKLLSGRLWTL